MLQIKLLKHTKIRKNIICGNEGFTSDTLHFAAEMVAGFEKTDRPRSSIALSENTSIVSLKI
ncbi:hypothetical protein ATZ36_17075 [Candidatus Endomicrobiellum trichonymphae]|jgi:phosphoheptose isomerase|uniref:Uncharacterized protein n=1 Tax=Endomicrobium trichonymphae TaxID=1408204 RepID=A0A1E5IL59_ENDTX|nr:hypothetical protein ATZ36_17075 [Candidatus Endomicrobium trichonymphae]